MKTVTKKATGVIRIFLIALINALILMVFVSFAPGVEIDSLFSAIVVVLLISFLNSFVFPTISRLTLPLTVVTLGIGSLIINGAVLLVLSNILRGFHLQNIYWAIFFVFVIAIVNALVSALLAIDDDESYRRNVIKKLSKKRTKDADLKTPGVVFVQIDGLAHDVLRRAMKSGNVPNITSWVREGKFRLEKWETGWQSQTGASQAGILMGSNNNIPAFRWYDKTLGKSVVVSSRTDLKILEKSLSNGHGLLFNNGASRGNLFSGDAEDTLLTISAIGRKNKNGLGYAYASYYSNPYNFPRTLVLFFADIFMELKSMISQRRRNVWPRMTHYKKSYPFLRAAITVGQRDIIIQTLIGDIYSGKDVIYADLVGYDEVAHHTGPERHETMGILRDIDKQLARLLMAIDDSEKPYNLVLLSDHGQTQGASFRQATGMGLDEYIESVTGGRNVSSEMENKEDVNMLGTAMLEITKTGGIVAKSIKKSNLAKNVVDDSDKKTTGGNDIKVLASGALGLVYFTKHKKRLTLEEINHEYPTLIENLVNHPLIGFILVDTKKDGGIAIGKDGKCYLKNGKVTGVNPLSIYGENTYDKVKRTNGFSNVADIMINSVYDPVMGEVFAFEEQVGSHGALGGDQNFPFILFPSSWEFPETGVMEAENVHKLFKKWLKKLGQEV